MFDVRFKACENGVYEARGSPVKLRSGDLAAVL
jgi:hypothetical protein